MKANIDYKFDGQMSTTTLNSFGRGTNWSQRCVGPNQTRTVIARSSLDEKVRIETVNAAWCLEWWRTHRGSGNILHICNRLMKPEDMKEMNRVCDSFGVELPEALQVSMPAESASQRLARGALDTL